MQKPGDVFFSRKFMHCRKNTYGYMWELKVLSIKINPEKLNQKIEVLYLVR